MSASISSAILRSALDAGSSLMLFARRRHCAARCFMCSSGSRSDAAMNCWYADKSFGAIIQGCVVAAGSPLAFSGKLTVTVTPLLSSTANSPPICRTSVWIKP